MSVIEKFEVPDGYLNIKRFYLPVEFEVECPKCKDKIIDDFEQQYLSYPEVNENEIRNLYCEYCELDFVYNVKVQITVEADMGSIREDGE